MNKINQKSSIYKLLIILIVILSFPISAMNKLQENTSINKDTSVDIEDYEQFIDIKFLETSEAIYSDKSFIKNSENIFEALEYILAKIDKLKNNISQKFYNDARFQELHQNTLNSYKELLKEYFLEKRENQEGLYPKNKEWIVAKFNKENAEELDQEIAKFIKNPQKNNPILFKLFFYCFTFKISTPHGLVNLLLFFGADPNLKINSARGPLIFAVIGKQEQNVKSLLAYGAEVDNHDIFGYSPLSIAIYNQLIPIIKLLLAKNPNVTISGYWGTPIELAKKINNPKILKLLKIEEESLWCSLF